MKLPTAKKSCAALTLIEVIALLAIIAAVLMVIQYRTGRQQHGVYIHYCLSNQKQLGFGIEMFATDNGNQYPMQTSVTNGGTLELIPNGNAAEQFGPMTNYIKSTGVYLCPSEFPEQTSSGTYPSPTLANTNLSYLLNVDAKYRTLAPLTGDRNLAVDGVAPKSGLFPLTNIPAMFWGAKMHSHRGIIGFNDGHSEVVTKPRLPVVFAGAAATTNRLVVP